MLSFNWHDRNARNWARRVNQQAMTENQLGVSVVDVNRVEVQGIYDHTTSGDDLMATKTVVKLGKDLDELEIKFSGKTSEKSGKTTKFYAGVGEVPKPFWNIDKDKRPANSWVFKTKYGKWVLFVGGESEKEVKKNYKALETAVQNAPKKAAPYVKK